jgi:hypothetical protein
VALNSQSFGVLPAYIFSAVQDFPNKLLLYHRSVQYDVLDDLDFAMQPDPALRLR